MSASYPASVKVFAARSNGQTIDAAHVGDLQDEVNAIEDGILNGTAPLVSSNTRVNNLQVNGGSSFAGNSTFAGSVAISSNLTVSGTLTVATAPPSVRVGNTAGGINIDNNVRTALTFNVQRFASAGMHSTTTNPTRLTAVSSGIYYICGGVNFVASTAGTYRQLGIRIDGSSMVAITQYAAPSVNGAQVLLNVSCLYRFASSGSYAELCAQHDIGSSANIVLGGQEYTPEFMMAQIR